MNYGDIPYIVRGTEDAYKKLFFSNPDHALTMQVTIRKGFGVIPAGTVMAYNGSATTAYQWFPYVPANPTPGQSQINSDIMTYAITATAGAAVVVVSVNDSYRFAVGDDLIISDTGTAEENLGAISSISVGESSASITATTNISGTFTAAQYATVYTEGTMASTGTPWMEGKGILMHTVDTGVGENAKGAVGVIILSNAMLYKGLLTNYDSAALSDLGASEIGQFLLMK